MSSNPNIQVGILGLGRLGTSVGLALNRYNQRKDARQQFTITAYDPRDSASKIAETRKAAGRFVRSAGDAAKDRDVVIVALPYAEVEAGYRAIAAALRPDAVVIDLSPLKQPSLNWAHKHLPETVHLVGMTPVLNPRYLYEGLDEAENAAEDLFDNGAMLLMPDKGAHSDAIQLASDLGTILGAPPHFLDPIEHDGVTALTEGLPALLGVAAFATLTRSAGWSDAQRAGNTSLGMLTHHLRDTHPDDLRDLLLLNREHMAHVLGEIIETLESLRVVLATGDRDAVEETIIQTAAAYDEWLRKRSTGRWDARDAADTAPTGSNLMNGLLGGYLARRLRGDKSQS